MEGCGFESHPPSHQCFGWHAAVMESLFLLLQLVARGGPSRPTTMWYPARSERCNAQVSSRGKLQGPRLGVLETICSSDSELPNFSKGIGPSQELLARMLGFRRILPDQTISEPNVKPLGTPSIKKFIIVTTGMVST